MLYSRKSFALLVGTITLSITSLITGYLLLTDAIPRTERAAAYSNSKSRGSLSLFSHLVKKDVHEPSLIIEPLATPTSAVIPTINPQKENQYHILLLGLDKRHPNQTSYRTDAIMLASVLENEKKVLLTSIPRDLYIGGAKINAHFCREGFDAFKQRIGKVTGIEPTYFITADFDSMVWAVDRMGGAKPIIERSFTDYSYPQDRPEANYPPSFQAGPQHLEGEAALQFCRSRKGTNGEGSDFRRMARQQTLLLSMPRAFETSDLPRMTLQALYQLFTGHLGTNLGIAETGELLSFLTKWQDFEVAQLVLTTQNFLYHPPNAQYGGAYVLRPRGDSYDSIQARVSELLAR